MDTTDPAPAAVASKEPERGKIILVSTPWWEVSNHIRYGIRFIVRILGGITHYLSLSLCLSPLNVPKTGFPWSIPPDLARLTPSDRYPELENDNFSPCSGTFDPNSPKFPGKFPRRDAPGRLGSAFPGLYGNFYGCF